MMRIPSPRTLIEILAYTFFAVFMIIGVIGAVVLLAAIAAIEKIYDGARGWRARRRA